MTWPVPYAGMEWANWPRSVAEARCADCGAVSDLTLRGGVFTCRGRHRIVVTDPDDVAFWLDLAGETPR